MFEKILFAMRSAFREASLLIWFARQFNRYIWPTDGSFGKFTREYKAEGFLNEVIGKAKQGIGEAVGSTKLQGEGQTQESKGSAQKLSIDAKSKTIDIQSITASRLPIDDDLVIKDVELQTNLRENQEKELDQAPSLSPDDHNSIHTTTSATRAGTEVPGIEAQHADGSPQGRVIDANLIVDRFIPGQVATLTVTIRLLTSPRRGKWVGFAALTEGEVDIVLELSGFSLISERPRPIPLVSDRDTSPAAFELQIEEAERRWIHIVLLQEGRSVGELSIDDFSAWLSEPSVQNGRSTTFRRIAEADLMLVIRAREGRIEVSSPRDRACLDHVTMLGFKYPELEFREVLRKRLRALYDQIGNSASAERELQIVGSELAECLPKDLIPILRKDNIRTVMLRHEDDFDFPLELVFLDDASDPYFVGDRMAICRWYLGVSQLPDIVGKSVRKIALLKGSAEASSRDEATIQRLYPGRSSSFLSKTEAMSVFKVSDYDVIHFAGHCLQSAAGEGGLEFADSSFLRLAEIGRLESEKVFGHAEPFVMLNACASAQPYIGLTQRGSFAHRFITSRACAVVGTMWPVDGTVASEFAEEFYQHLASKPIGRAIIDAKMAVLSKGREGSDVDAERALARRIAVRSYCMYANPDFRLNS